MDTVWVVCGQRNMDDDWNCAFFRTEEGANKERERLNEQKEEAIKAGQTKMEDVFYYVSEHRLQD
jgi:hypothetical protein